MSKRMFARITLLLGGILAAVSCASIGETSDQIPVSVESQLASGAPIYADSCATSICHGTQGEGIKSGDGFKVWPLVGEEFQSRHPNAQIVFNVIRSGGEPNLRALTDQQVYDSIAYELVQNGIQLDSPLSAANAYSTFGGEMSGTAQGKLFPPSRNATMIDPPHVRALPVVEQNTRLRLQLDQLALASAIGTAQPPEGGALLLLVLVFSDLDDEPTTVSPEHLRLLTPDGEVLEPQDVAIQSAIEKFHARTIKRHYATVGLVVFALKTPDGFEALIYDDGQGDPITMAIKP